MTEDHRKALIYLKKVFKTKTAFELNRIVEKMAKGIRMESQKESNPKEKFKSEFTDGD